MEHPSTQRKLLHKPLSLPTKNSRQKPSPNRLIVPMKVHNTRPRTKRIISVKESLQEDVIEQILITTTPVEKPNTNLHVKSALTKHYLSTGHIFSDTDFKILLSDQHRYRLLVKESLLIRQRDPKLNGTERSLPLYIYPDGLTNNQMAISKRNNPTTNTNNTTGMNDPNTNTGTTNSVILDPPKHNNPSANNK
jgi:hypothetical protein